ncbi:hypothetical protein HanPI659440_Chr00c07g0718821 [Helianthus annuus]|nr:hypothetical protein HanPI659440_Chr00c07g0718821 [Helianthus annuus]
MAYNSTLNYLNLVRRLADARYHVPEDIKSSLMGYAKSVYQSDLENRYSEPMVWIGIYITLASLCCILAMLADLLHGLKNRKLWIPCKYFTFNAASLTVIAVAMKLPVDLTGPMPGVVDQLAKLGSMAFMCNMMANLLPSLAAMDRNGMLANVTALGVLVITLVVNVCIQIQTGVVVSNGGEAAKILQMISTGDYVSKDLMVSNKITCSTIAIIYSALLLLLLIIHICSSLAVLKSKEILKRNYHQEHIRDSKDVQQLARKLSTVEKLQQHVEKYWIMVGISGSPQYLIPCSVTITASGVICAFTTILHTLCIKWSISDIMGGDYGSDYKWTALLILIVQSIGVFRVENLWTQKLYDWKYGIIPLPFRSSKLRMIIKSLKILVLSFCIKFQEGVVIVCKIITLIPFFFMICVLYCLRCLKWFLQAVLNSSFFCMIITRNMEQRPYVLHFVNEKKLAEITLEATSESLKQLIQNSEKKQPRNLIDLIDKKTTGEFQGVKTFDNNDYHVQYGDCWSLPVVTLTTIAITLPNIKKAEAKSLFNSVREGLKYVTLVEENFYATDDYESIQKAAKRLWEEVDIYDRWLGIRLKDITSQVYTVSSQVDASLQIIQFFMDKAMNKINKRVDDDSEFTYVCANSMYRITRTIIDDRNIHNRLFDELSSRIADILAACLTNLPQVIAMKCHTNVTEKREACVLAAAQLLGETKQILNKLQDWSQCMNPEDLPFIDKWRVHLSYP